MYYNFFLQSEKKEEREREREKDRSEYKTYWINEA